MTLRAAIRVGNSTAVDSTRGLEQQVLDVAEKRRARALAHALKCCLTDAEAILQRIRLEAPRGHIPSEAVDGLESRIANIQEQGSVLRACIVARVLVTDERGGFRLVNTDKAMP
jgi:hypothetical protein